MRIAPQCSLYNTMNALLEGHLKVLVSASTSIGARRKTSGMCSTQILVSLCLRFDVAQALMELWDQGCLLAACSLLTLCLFFKARKKKVWYFTVGTYWLTTPLLCTFQNLLLEHLSAETGSYMKYKECKCKTFIANTIQIYYRKVYTVY